MALPDDHLPKFYKMDDAKEMWEAIKSKFGGNDESKKMHKYLLKQQFEGFSVSASESLHKGYGRFQTLLSQLEIHGAGISHEDANQKFLSTNDVSTAYSVSSPSILKSHKEGSSSYTDEVIHSFFANQLSAPQLNYDDLEQINDDDIEEMDLKWQVAMISMRIKKFHKRTRRKLQFDTKDLVGFDKTKVECSISIKGGILLETAELKGIKIAEEEMVGTIETKLETMEEDLHIRMIQKLWLPLMERILTGSDNKVKSCSKTCEESYARLKKLYDEQKDKLGDASVEIIAYLDNKTDVLAYHKKLLAEALKEKEDLKTKFENWQNSSKNLSRLLNTQMSANDKFGIGYGDYIYGSILSYENEVLQSVFMNKQCDLKDTPVNDRYAEGMHAVSSPMTGNYMPSGPNVEIDDSKFTYGPKQTLADESDSKHVEYASSESDSSVETTTSMHAPVKSAPKVVCEPKVWIDAPIIKEYESDSDDDLVSKVQEETKKPSFAFIDSLKYVESPRENVRWIEMVWVMLLLEKHALFVGNGNTAVKASAEFKGGSVSFGGSNKRITGKEKIKTDRLDFEDVYYVEELKHYNLFFVSQMCEKKNKVLFTDTDCLVLSSNFKLPDENKVLLKIPRQHYMSDNGTEFKNNDLIGFCGLKCIKREYSNAKTPQQNEVAERKNRTLIEADRTMLADLFLPTTFWAKAVNTACYVLNKVLVTKPQNKTPYELLTGIDLHDEHSVLRIWSDYSTTVKSSRDKIQKTTDCKTCRKKATHENQNANTNSTNLLNAVSTPFSTVGPSIALNDDEPSYPDDPSMPHLEDIYARPSEGIFTDSSYDDEGVVTDFNNLETTVTVSPTPTTRLHTIHPKTQILGDPLSVVHTRSKVHKNSEAHALVSYIQKQQRNNNKDFQRCLFACFLSQIEHKKISQALEDKSWVDAMQEELLQFQIQKDEMGAVVRNKARLVAQGHRQEEGIYYDEVFAPVARIKAIRIFLAFASYMGFIVYQMDVKSAFLYGTIDEEVYVTQPLVFEDPKFPNKVYKVVKLCMVYIKLPEIDEFLGEPTFFLGFQVKQKEDGIFISQDKYVAEILKKFDFLSVKTASTPIETQKPLVKYEEVADVDVHLYRSMIGSLMYLTASRPDIMFAVCACSRFQVTPKTSHLQVMKRIFRYLKGQPKLGLWYPKVSSFNMESYSDSDYAGANLNRKSITGGCQFLGRRLISWQCKKHTIMATSTTEAEYVAAAHCRGQVLWIQNQLLDYGFNIMSIKIYIDNESTICIVKNPVFHSKTKHIEIRHNFIRDAYEKKLIQVLKIHTDDNVADPLTKAFDGSSKELDSPKQTALGKDETNSLIVNSLLKTILLSMHHVLAMKHWLFQSKWLLYQFDEKDGIKVTAGDLKLMLLGILLLLKELASPKQMALGKDASNPLIVDSLLKTIWSSIHHVIAMKHWLFQSKRQLVKKYQIH
nr:hypothetical protein [Tanacetum cinerariifolium]